MLKIAWSPLYAHPLPAEHRFPMQKYNLLREQLLYEGTVTEAHFFEPGDMSLADILTTHCEQYVQQLESGTLSPRAMRQTGFPYSPELIRREKCIMQGTWEAAGWALKYGMGINVAGGTHHAFFDRGEGFCLLNDLALTANLLRKNQLVNRILILDLDVHQGNGTASLMAHVPEVFTCSVHCGNNYPFHKEKSSLDIELPAGISDEEYLKVLDIQVNPVFDSFQPDFLLYQSGVDVLATDKLGKLGLSRQGCAKRDQWVLETAKRHRIPVAASMGGGYSARISDIVEAHAAIYRMAQQVFF